MHFTYAQPKDELSQGDILHRTEALVALLKQVHPHFASDKYKYFMVLTQSCDLVRREGVCGTRYITIAAVRSLRDALERELEKIQYDDVERRVQICLASRKVKLTQFMERLFNNNEPEYFFLYQEPKFGLTENHCAFLQLSVPLKSEHYSTLLRAKKLQLAESFQHKLGSLVGTIFSRIGTDDWLPGNCDPDVFLKLTNEPVDDEGLVLWLEKDVHKQVLQQLKALPVEEQTQPKLNEVLSSISAARGSRIDEVLKTIACTLEAVGVEAELVEKSIRRLRNESLFTGRVR